MPWHLRHSFSQQPLRQHTDLFERAWAVHEERLIIPRNRKERFDFGGLHRQARRADAIADAVTLEAVIFVRGRNDFLTETIAKAFERGRFDGCASHLRA
jgi:hypothetical protein